MRTPKYLIIYEIPTELDNFDFINTPRITYEDYIVCYDDEEKNNHLEMLNQTYKYELNFSVKVYKIDEKNPDTGIGPKVGY